MIVLYLVLFALFLIVVINGYEKRSIGITSYTIENSNIQTQREYIVISDLHGMHSKNDFSNLLEKIKKTNVNSVIIAGDMVNGDLKSDWNNVLIFFEKLSEFCKIFYIDGNHEQRMHEGNKEARDKYGRYSKRLRELGVVRINNESIVDEDVLITGLVIPKYYYKKRFKQKLSYEEISDVVKSDSTRCNILVTHNPRYMETYLKTDFDIIISGHFHGGMIRIPYIGGVMSTQMDFFPKYSGGIYNRNNKFIVVSRGLGNHFPGIRVNNKPEIIKIKLQKKR